MVTPHLQIIRNGAKALVYDSVSGGKLIVNDAALQVIELLRQGRGVEDIRDTYEAPGLDALIAALTAKGLLHSGNAEAEPAPQHGPAPDKIHCGGLLRQLRLNVTESCNLDCTYCYEKASEVFTKRRTMDWKVAKNSIDAFLKVTGENKQPSIGFRFFGGEPLINWPVIKKSIEYIREQAADGVAVNFIVNTNGTLLNEEIIKVFCSYNVFVSLSLDGVEEVNDRFRKFRDGRGIFRILDEKILLLTRYGARFGIAVVFYDQNLPHLNKLIDYIKRKQEETGRRINVNFSPLARVERRNMDNLAAADKAAYLTGAIKYARQQGVQCYGGLSHFPFTKLLNGITGTFCSGAGAEFSIAPEGSIYPCAGLDLKLGHLDAFTDVFHNPLYGKIAVRRAGNLPHCRGCPIEGFCSGGCLADVQFSAGDIYGICQDCDFQRALFKELVKNYIIC